MAHRLLLCISTAAALAASLADFRESGLPAAKEAREQQETAMNKIMSVIAIALSLLGSANLAMAQSYPNFGANTGSEANRAAHNHDGEYTGD
jgi:hypothetical protein